MNRLMYEFVMDVFTLDDDGNAVGEAFVSVPITLDILQVDTYMTSLDESGEATRTCVYMSNGNHFVLNITYPAFKKIMAKVKTMTIVSQAATFYDC